MLIGGGISAFAVPFLALSRRQHSPADLGDDASPAAPSSPASAEPADG